MYITSIFYINTNITSSSREHLFSDIPLRWPISGVNLNGVGYTQETGEAFVSCDNEDVSLKTCASVLSVYTYGGSPPHPSIHPYILEAGFLYVALAITELTM